MPALVEFNWSNTPGLIPNPSLRSPKTRTIKNNINKPYKKYLFCISI